MEIDNFIVDQFDDGAFVQTLPKDAQTAITHAYNTLKEDISDSTKQRCIEWFHTHGPYVYTEDDKTLKDFLNFCFKES